MFQTMSDLALASEFPAATREQWAASVERVLKGVDFEKKLVSRTYDGLRIEPLYPKAERAEPVPRADHTPWRVAQRVDHPDPAAANALALADLEGGADALVLSLAGAPTARGFGLAAATVDDLDRALAGVMLDLIAISVEAAPFGARAAATMVSELVRRRGHALADLTLDFGLDPVGDLARTGSLALPWPELSRRFAGHVAEITGQGFGGSTVRVDTRPYHEAGASEAQELAAALATGVAYLRALEADGHALDAVRRSLSFLLVADADEFLTVAKLRAMRRLWAQVESACGLDVRSIRLNAETAWRMTTRRDPWVNLLRGTMAAFSAGIAGADSVTVLPFTAAIGLPDAFARRLSRNTQLILIEESNLWRVADPVSGSGAFESLTDALVAEGWARFQEIEREGGIVASLISGGLSRRLAENRAKRNAATGTRRDPITGTSEFPDIREQPVSVLKAAPVLGPAAGQALPSIRTAEAYEGLRDLSDEVLARSGARPKIFLANLGPIAAFSARATFAKNAFEAGGIEALNNDGFSDAAELAAAFSASGARIACVCSSDEIYTVQAATCAAALQAAGARSIFLAGRPGQLETTLREAGVNEFVFAGSNLLALLDAALSAATA
jgi:methylmalonyl-CoA mutase